EPRLPKRKVVLMMGFCGTGYQGMQVNPGAKTIEGDLFAALVAAGAVSKDNADDPKKVGLMRAARTDKGVHAAGQVISLKIIALLAAYLAVAWHMIVEDPNILDKINSHLPDQIRVWGFVRSMNSFHAKNMCDSRIYEYLLPTYVLQSQDVFKAPAMQTDVSAAEGKVYTDVETGAQFVWVPPVPSTPEEMAERRAYRIDEATLARVREALGMYEGTHNFHNYTCGKRATEESAKRFIISFKCSDPFMHQGTEWLSLKVHGQSFMLHQIRKMVSMMVLLVRTGTPLSVIGRSFAHNKINIPKAPGLGLLLEQTVFQSYSRKCQEQHGREPIDFGKYQDAIDEFKRTQIYQRIVAEELQFNK
ncbi:pseudouridine synthase, partial [Thamnocephalis sphaerospora]